MNLKQQLEVNGFTFEVEDNGLFSQYVKNIGEDGKQLVFAITPLPEVFVWLPDDESENKDEDGVRVVLDVDTVEKAILVAECIAGIESDF